MYYKRILFSQKFLVDPRRFSMICYEIFVRSFCDSNRDGVGDLNGVTAKLDYLQALGVDAIWLSPICKSPSYHKYDVIDYLSIDPEFGSLENFKNLIYQAHARNIKVIFDFVINHTSSQHSWFLEAKKSQENHFRNYYTWLNPAKIEELGLAIREKTGDSTETQPWHWAAKGEQEKYYGMFYSGMPDLNMDNPVVRQEIYEIGKYWLELGVDGFRMDAAKHIYPDWEVEKCHDFWVEFKQEMEAVKPDVYIVGEVWTAAEKIAPFFRGLKANFNFDLSLAIQNIVKTEIDDCNIVEMLLRNYKIFAKENPDFIDATMLTNHDQERIGSVAEGHIGKLKMAAGLLLTLPGNPYIYYGEELGMQGKKPDENIREAFLWNTRFKDTDRTNWRKPKYNTDSKVTPLALQIEDASSLFNHYKNLISLRKKHKGLNCVSPPNLKLSTTKNKSLISFIRPHKDYDLLILQNITSETLEFDLTEICEEIVFSTENSTTNNQKVLLNAFGLLVLKIK